MEQAECQAMMHIANKNKKNTGDLLPVIWGHTNGDMLFLNSK